MQGDQVNNQILNIEIPAFPPTGSQIHPCHLCQFCSFLEEGPKDSNIRGTPKECHGCLGPPRTSIWFPNISLLLKFWFCYHCAAIVFSKCHFFTASYSFWYPYENMNNNFPQVFIFSNILFPPSCFRFMCFGPSLSRSLLPQLTAVSQLSIHIHFSGHRVETQQDGKYERKT